MNRRSFLAAILAASAAPAIVRASSLMPLWTPPRTIPWQFEELQWSEDTLSVVRQMQAHQAELNRLFSITVEYMRRDGHGGVLQASLVPDGRQIVEVGKLPVGAVIRRVRAPIGVEVDQAWLAPVDRETRERRLIAFTAPADEPS